MYLVRRGPENCVSRQDGRRGGSGGGNKSSWAKMFAVPAEEKLVGHAGDVIANGDVAWFGVGEFFVGGGHGARGGKIVCEEFFEAADGAVAILSDSGIIVNVGEKEVFELFDKYNLRSLSVVDPEGRPMGVITVDDVVTRLSAHL